MTPRSTSPVNARALVVWEVLIAIAVIGCVVVLLLVAGDRQRRASGLEQSIANLRQIGSLQASYGNDNAGFIGTLSWQVGDEAQSMYSDLRPLSLGDLEAQSTQAVDVMRRLTGGTQATMPRASFVPGLTHWNLPLADYAGQAAPTPWSVSPVDLPRLGWRKTGVGPNPGNADNYRWVYSSSYEMPPAFWSSDFGNSASNISTVYQADRYYAFQTLGTTQKVFGRRRFDQITYPGQKVLLFEQFCRFFGPRDEFSLYPDARPPMLMCDGAATARAVGDSNLGANPTRPTLASTMVVTYVFSQEYYWNPSPIYSPGGDALPGRIRWTRYGLRGRDFDGPETTTPP